jgi:hypothetical protein
MFWGVYRYFSGLVLTSTWVVTSAAHLADMSENADILLIILLPSAIH